MKHHSDSFHSLLRLQAGVASVAQARLIGFSPDEIAGRRRRGHWEMIHPGVITTPAVPPTWERDVIAGCLFLGTRAVASRATAARLLGLDPFVRSKSVEFTALPPHRGSGRGLHVHTTRRLEPADLTTFRRALPAPVPVALARVGVVRTIRLTSAARTIIDLASTTDAETLGNVIDSAIQRRLTSALFLSGRAADLGGRGLKGGRRLAEVMLDAGGHSWLERRFLQLLRRSGLPRPRCQVQFAADGLTVARVDFFFEGTRVIVEVSGRRGHASEHDRRRDARRRNALQRACFEVLEFVTTDVMSDPRYVIATLSDALAGRTVVLRRSAPLA